MGPARAARPPTLPRLTRVLTRIDLRGRAADARSALPRATFDVDAALAAVRPICEAVRTGGRAGVLEWTERLDGVRLDRLRVPEQDMAAALAALDPAVRLALEEAINRARSVLAAQRHDDVTVDVAAGLTVTERSVPVGRVGLYVPGGRVAYPSSVVMNVVPAQVAGVTSIAVTSPPQAWNAGRPHPSILAACALLDIAEVYQVGGAQAIAMFAYGVDDCAPVDLITGPGNVYVTAAKRLLRGVVGIDSENGPTEIIILADDTAHAGHLAADLVAQAEHDPLAACVLVSPSSALLDQVDAELAAQVPQTRHRERVAAALRGQSALVLVDDLDAGLLVVDGWAAEHVEVVCRDAAAVAGRLRNAGAVFVGPFSPVSLGDYLAGSNHVLPTGGTARHTGGLSARSFLRGQYVVTATREALLAAAPHVRALAGAEDLAAHADAVNVRVHS